MTECPKFVLVHEACGHVLGYANNRHVIQPWKNKLTIYGFKGWVIEERDATDDELLQLVDAERCIHCTVDGNLRQVIR